jgi:hypothetical protein
MPVDRQLGLWVELVKAARGEGGEILPQQSVVQIPGEVLDHPVSGIENRARSCSITFSSAAVKPEVSEESGSLWFSMSRRGVEQDREGA